ncbi:hypothetical protein [Nocardia flavorosea]|uniref:hypothetical protein n=2 Tax=Nocardia TaxID=1817 RepID=UPI001E513F6F|nr:hypothetical protein [Nocardia flavorosea]
MMGDQTTTDLPGAAEVPDTRKADAEPVVTGSSGSRAMVGRVLGWLVFAGGLGAAVFGIATLHVVISVIGLILACTAGLTLLKLRADGPGPEPEVRIAG